MNNTKRPYIAPGEVGRINGFQLRAESLLEINLGVLNPVPSCNYCAFKNDVICFDKERPFKSLSTRPACMGNDKENIDNIPVYYVKL